MLACLSMLVLGNKAGIVVSGATKIARVRTSVFTASNEMIGCCPAAF